VLWSAFRHTHPLVCHEPLACHKPPNVPCTSQCAMNPLVCHEPPNVPCKALPTPNPWSHTHPSLRALLQVSHRLVQGPFVIKACIWPASSNTHGMRLHAGTTHPFAHSKKCTGRAHLHPGASHDWLNSQGAGGSPSQILSTSPEPNGPWTLRTNLELCGP